MGDGIESCDLRANERPWKKLHRKGTRYIHTYNIWTDIATTRPNRPSGPIRWKYTYLWWIPILVFIMVTVIPQMPLHRLMAKYYWKLYHFIMFSDSLWCSVVSTLYIQYIPFFQHHNWNLVDAGCVPGTRRLQYNETEEATIEPGGGKGQASKVIKTLNMNHNKQYEASIA